MHHQRTRSPRLSTKPLVPIFLPIEFEHLAFKERMKRAYLTEINQGLEANQANASLLGEVFEIDFRARDFRTRTPLPVQPPSQNLPDDEHGKQASIYLWFVR